MRSIAVSNAPRIALFVTLLAAASFCGLAQQQAVECSDPPGGVITCEKGQLATCTVVKGKIEGRCQTPPGDLTEKPKLDAWILGQVTRRAVAADEAKTPELQSILKSGRWQAGDRAVTFQFNDAVHVTGSHNAIGNINQEGQNNIAQLGNNNNATINPKMSPYDTVILYSPNGSVKRIIRDGGSKIEAEVGGPTSDSFQTIAKLEHGSEWQSMLSFCKEEEAKEPQWPTLYLCAAEAHIELGQLEDADKEVKQAKDIAHTSEDYAPIINLIQNLLERAREKRP